MENSEQKNKMSDLQSLRQSILSETTPLLDGSTLDPEDRFNLFLRLAQSQSSVELYKKVFDIAKTIDNNDSKLQYYMEILDSIELEINDLTDVVEAEQTENNDYNESQSQ